jgi:hypothetical protein
MILVVPCGGLTFFDGDLRLQEQKETEAEEWVQVQV